MDVVVRGKNRQVPARLKALAQEKVARVARLTHDAGRIEIDFSEIRNPREPNRQVCEITVHLKRHFVKAHVAATEPEAALDLAVDKVEYQVARIKDKRVARTHARDSNGHAAGNGPAMFEAGSDDADDDELEGPRIVKRKRFATKPMDPEEATLQMELLGHAFFFFTNTETGRAALLYRRADGDLGLIETSA
ncbi:MAG: ribosome-associated translation inhibitor RaiA [Acidimicrobiia bacterium]